MNSYNSRYDERKTGLIDNPQFWSIASIFILITLHHYNDQTGFMLFSIPDKELHITRHTIDRILYLIPIILSSIIFGLRGGLAALVMAFTAMLPRAIFISESPVTASLETFGVVAIGGFAPLWAHHSRKETTKLVATQEKLHSTQQKLQSEVQRSTEKKKQLSVINSFSVMLSQSLDMDRVLQSAIKMVKEVMQIEVVIIFSLEDITERLSLIAYEGISEKSAAVLDGMKLGEGLCGRVAKTGQPILIEDLLNNPELCSITAREEQLDVQLSVPLMSRGEIKGTLCVATRSKREFNEAEIELLSALGSLIGIAVDKAQLLREREKAAEQLTLSERKYRELFENAHVAIWIQNATGEITDANQAAADLFGCILPELIGSNIKQFVPGHSYIASDISQMSYTDINVNYRAIKQSVLKRDGTEATILVTANIVSDNGHPGGFQFIGRDITNELRMQENEQFYIKQITNAHEEERLRISRDLHDSTAQNLIAILRQLERFCQEDKDIPETKINFLWNVYDQLKDTFKDLRRLSRDLRPSIIDDLGIIPAVEWLIEQFNLENNVRASLNILGDEKRFSPEIEVTLFRIVQEALRNIARHAKATEASINIVMGEDEITILISDNGVGFVIPISLGDFSRIGKLGIDGMKTRARLIGGTFDIRSELGKGTTVIVVIPTFGR